MFQISKHGFSPVHAFGGALDGLISAGTTEETSLFTDGLNALNEDFGLGDTANKVEQAAINAGVTAETGAINSALGTGTATPATAAGNTTAKPTTAQSGNAVGTAVAGTSTGLLVAGGLVLAYLLLGKK